LREIQLPVDQGMASTRAVGQEHPDLAILHPPGGSRILPGHACGLDALLQEPAVVDDQHGLRIVEVFDHVVPDVVTDRIDVPVRPPQQPLHAVR
jgi:hypothetical protein